MSDERIIAGLQSMKGVLDTILTEIKTKQETEGPRTRGNGPRKEPRVEVVISMADVMEMLSYIREDIAAIKHDQMQHWRDFLAHDHPQPKPPQLRIGERPAVVTGESPTEAAEREAATPLRPIPPLHRPPGERPE